ncbi:MAG TPA: hypothetical protein VNL70_03665 [Tepidisphaeraceae bacterium]|nr:hypothetical protein [Tepidisphaeraceae bacterium]
MNPIAEMEEEFQAVPAPPRPRTATVFGLMSVVAAVLSYLGAYAMTGALVAAELIKPWPADRDPRLRWFVVGFLVLMALFTAAAALARYVGARHLKAIEQMEQEESSPDGS